LANSEQAQMLMQTPACRCSLFGKDMRRLQPIFSYILYDKRPLRVGTPASWPAVLSAEELR
jgi:hypothetical protein